MTNLLSQVAEFANSVFPMSGVGTKPVISQTRPTLPPPSKSPLSVIMIEIEDADILNFITGGLPALKAYTTQRVRVVGDLILAQQLEDVFTKAGGKEKAMAFLEKVTGKKVVAQGGKKSKSKL